jgi:hypothetical protein
MAKKDRSKDDLIGGIFLLIMAVCFVVPTLVATHPMPPVLLVVALICAALGVFVIINGLLTKSRRRPTQEIMRLAEQRHGILTLSEIATALNLDPKVVQRTLQQLSETGIAQQRWQEFRKNIWEFPDYMKLPLSESLELAKAKGGRLTLEDLTAAGHSPDTARQTLDTLNDKGLAHPDPASPSSTQPALIVTTQ